MTYNVVGGWWDVKPYSIYLYIC